MTTNYCLVSFSSKGRSNYNEWMPKLIQSADANIPQWGKMFFSPDYDIALPYYKLMNHRYPEPKLFKCYKHSEIPYQFKLAAIQEAREAGFTKVFWMDTSIVFYKNIEELWKFHNNTSGIIAFHNLGHRLDHYISDQALSQLKITAEQAKEMPQIWGGALGFDFDNPVSCMVFDEIVKLSLDGKTFQESGSTRPDFKAHRHDQAAISVILHKHNIPIFPYGKIVIRQHSVEPFEYGQDFYLIYG